MRGTVLVAYDDKLIHRTQQVQESLELAAKALALTHKILAIKLWREAQILAYGMNDERAGLRACKERVEQWAHQAQLLRNAAQAESSNPSGEQSAPGLVDYWARLDTLCHEKNVAYASYAEADRAHRMFPSSVQEGLGEVLDHRWVSTVAITSYEPKGG